MALASPCPGSCAQIRSLLASVLGVGAALYIIGLSAVLAWVSGLQRRGLADAVAARDWYLLAAGVGLPIAPLLAFTLVSALR